MSASDTAPAPVLAPAPDGTAGPLPVDAPTTTPKGGKTARLVVLAALAVVGLGYFAFQWWTNRGFETTDNAQVEGHITPVLPRASGYVLEVRADENDVVQAGDTLLVIDARTSQEQLAMAEANLQAAIAGVNEAGQTTSAAAQTETAQSQAGALDAQAGVVAAQAQAVAAQASAAAAQAQAAQAAVAQAQANASKARSDVDRYTPLVERQIVSRQQYDAAVAAAAAADAQVTAVREAASAARETAQAARAQAAAAQAQIGTARGNAAAARAGIGTARAGQTSAQSRVAASRAGVAAAEAAVEQARLQVGYTVVLAPVSGVVSNRNVEVGQLLQAGQPVMSVTPLDDVWVTANLKETQVAGIRPGEAAEVTVDAYPGVRYTGTVESMSPATGAEFSLLPPDNATGNFTKVVQRIPVRIRVEAAAGSLPLRPGMSAEVRIDTNADARPAADETDGAPARR